MTLTPSTLIVAAVWSSIGVLIAVYARRNGHDFKTFLGLGIAYGPLVVIFFFEENRPSQPESTVLQTGHPVNRHGWLDVIVGLDGAPESLESAKHVVNDLGPSIRRLRLASVLDVEVLNIANRFSQDEERIEALQEAAFEMGFDDAEMVLLSGRADEALVQHAVEQQMDLLVVAHRRHRASAVLVGSTVARLARNAEIPVLIGPPAALPEDLPEPLHLAAVAD